MQLAGRGDLEDEKVLLKNITRVVKNDFRKCEEDEGIFRNSRRQKFWLVLKRSTTTPIANRRNTTRKTRNLLVFVIALFLVVFVDTSNNFVGAEAVDARSTDETNKPPSKSVLGKNLNFWPKIFKKG